MDRNFRNVDTLSLLMTFMALPGLQDVTISKAISRKLSPWPYGSRSSNVVHILLHDVAITGESLKMLLSRCKALKSFGYTPCHPNELGLLSLASGIDLSRKAALKAITRSARQCSNCILRGEYRVKSNRTSQQGAWREIVRHEIHRVHQRLWTAIQVFCFRENRTSLRLKGGIVLL